MQLKRSIWQYVEESKEEEELKDLQVFQKSFELYLFGYHSSFQSFINVSDGRITGDLTSMSDYSYIKNGQESI